MPLALAPPPPAGSWWTASQSTGPYGPSYRKVSCAMGKAFRRLEKQVGDRRAGANRVVSWQSRIRNLEVYLLELGSYLQTIATDKESAADSALAEAHAEYRKVLEGVVQ